MCLPMNSAISNLMSSLHFLAGTHMDKVSICLRITGKRQHCHWQENFTCQVLQVSGSRDTTIRLWKRAASEAVAMFSAHSLPVTGLAPIDHHNQTCSGSRDCTLRLWDVGTGSQVACTALPQNVVTFMKAIPAESAVLQCGEDLQLRV